MKLIHCADLHLDSDLGTNLKKDQIRERKAELLNTFHRMVEYADIHGVEGILIAGDLFDKKNISAKARNAVLDEILHHEQIRFYYLRGNHDGDNVLAFAQKQPQNLYLFDHVWTTYELRENVRITGLELDEKNAAQAAVSLVLDADKFNIVMLHGQESEHQTRNKAEVIGIRELRGHFIDYLALGHIHSHKVEKLDARGIYCYPGCLEGRGYDEAGVHGFELLEIDEQKRTLTHEFIPFAKRQIHVENVDITDCQDLTRVQERMEEVLKEKQISPESMVKLVLVGTVDISLELDLQLLLQKLEERFYHVKLKNETVLKVDYAALETEQSLKGEFVRVVKASQLTDEEKAEVIKLGIAALAGEDLEICG
jgi:DNA repair exonuclease SbcCD nuclease subunit